MTTSSCARPNRNRLQATLSVCLLALFVAVGAQALETGQSLPPLSIDRAGELAVENNKSTYQPWSTEQLTAPLTLLQILKASKSAADINMPFLDNFENRFGGDQRIASVTIIDTNSIPSLMGGFVKRELKKNKVEHPQAVMINDKTSAAAAAWSLPKAQAIIVLLDADQQVLMQQVGQIPAAEHENWLAVIQAQLESDAAK